MSTKLNQVEVNSNASRAMVARISDEGDFVFAGHEDIEARDIGDAEGRYAGATDYQLTVPAAFKDTMLLWLVKERFDSEADLEAWLSDKDIPRVFRNTD